jgi:hypothetical protein
LHEQKSIVFFFVNPCCSSNKTGTAYTFFTKDNARQAKDLIKVLTEAKQVIHPKLQELQMSARGMAPRNRWYGGGGGRSFGGRGGGGRGSHSRF